MGILDSLFGKKKASIPDKKAETPPAKAAAPSPSPQPPPSPRPAPSAPSFTRAELKIHPPGTIIANQYEVASRPLMGGMGIVYLCLDRHEGIPVALKTFRPEYLSDREARDRFLREGTTWPRAIGDVVD